MIKTAQQKDYGSLELFLGEVEQVDIMADGEPTEQVKEVKASRSIDLSISNALQNKNIEAPGYWRLS